MSRSISDGIFVGDHAVVAQPTNQVAFFVLSTLVGNRQARSCDDDDGRVCSSQRYIPVT
jgi:hypothetical protein